MKIWTLLTTKNIFSITSTLTDQIKAGVEDADVTKITFTDDTKVGRLSY